MRLWSLHPKYLDVAGLTACWREALLARHVLLGLTQAYKHHPQLIRFQKLSNPIVGIDTYLYYILKESQSRGYHYNSNKIEYYNLETKIELNDKQLEYEFQHLKKKLKSRNPQFYEKLLSTALIQPHPMFIKKSGDIEAWEIRR